MLVSEFIEVSWTRRNIKHYKSKGYEYTNLNDRFNVKVCDLSTGSHVKVKCKCDYCGDIVEKPYKAYLSQTNNGLEEDTCISCAYNKAQKSNLIKYGVKNPMQVDEFKHKLINTLYENGTAPTSSQQLYIHTLIGGELNFPQESIMLDVAFPNEKIYFEYDGSGHDLQVKFKTLTQKEFYENERKRSYFLYRKGWRELRIISNDDKLPNNNMIVDFVYRSKSFFNGKNYFSIRWDLNDGDVSINYKTKVSINEFLDVSSTLHKEVS
ncbi:hypothetical protein [Psychrobacillus phage Perkons]|nr:hypothetical protein [Psychrobacillus phage Perkons]